MRRLLLAGALAAALALVPAAVAATPGELEGWLYTAKGKRWTGTPTTLRVSETGDRFRLSTYNLRLGCPYLDRRGRPAKARFRFVHRGVVQGEAIDDTRSYPARRPTHEVRVRGRFVGSRFVGRIRVSSAPGIAGACTGSARVKLRR